MNRFLEATDMLPQRKELATESITGQDSFCCVYKVSTQNLSWLVMFSITDLNMHCFTVAGDIQQTATNYTFSLLMLVAGSLQQYILVSVNISPCLKFLSVSILDMHIMTVYTLAP